MIDPVPSPPGRDVRAPEASSLSLASGVPGRRGSTRALRAAIERLLPGERVNFVVRRPLDAEDLLERLFPGLGSYRSRGFAVHVTHARITTVTVERL